MKAEDLSARAVLITGTSSGIGKACALHLDRVGYQVFAGGIHVSIVQPGDIATPAWQKALEAADEMLAAWPPQAFALYGPIVEMMRKIASEPRGIPAEEVAKVVARLLSTARPQARTLVGTDAKTLALIEKLPTPIRDWIIVRQLPKYGEGLGRKGTF